MTLNEKYLDRWEEAPPSGFMEVNHPKFTHPAGYSLCWLVHREVKSLPKIIGFKPGHMVSPQKT